MTDIDTFRSFWVAFIAVVILFTRGFRLFFFFTSPVSFQLDVSRGNRSMEITLSLPPSAVTLWLNARFPSARERQRQISRLQTPNCLFSFMVPIPVGFHLPKKTKADSKPSETLHMFLHKVWPDLLEQGRVRLSGWDAFLCKWLWTSSHGLLIRICSWYDSVSQWFLFGFP